MRALRVADRFAGPLTNAPHFPANHQRLIGAWRLAVGDVDGEPAVILLQRGPDAWAPRSLVHLDITDGRITRIADFWHTPWILQTQVPWRSLSVVCRARRSRNVSESTAARNSSMTQLEKGARQSK